MYGMASKIVLLAAFKFQSKVPMVMWRNLALVAWVRFILIYKYTSRHLV